MGPRLFELVGLLALAADPIVEEVGGLAKILHDYGPWGFVVLETGAIVWLAKVILTLQKERAVDAAALTKALMTLVENETASNVEVKNSSEKLAQALTAQDRRLENVEKVMERLQQQMTDRR